MTTETKIVNPYRRESYPADCVICACGADLRTIPFVELQRHDNCRNPYLALLDAEKKDIERMAFWQLAKLIVIALSIGICLVPFLMPWGN